MQTRKKEFNPNGFSANFAQEMLRQALRDSRIGGLLVRSQFQAENDDDSERQRHLSFSGVVEGETSGCEIAGECWIQRSAGSSGFSTWKYGQIEFTVDDSMTRGQVPRMYYHLDPKLGMQRIHDLRVVMAHYHHLGEFSAWFAGEPRATVPGSKSKAEALGLLLLLYPERLALIIEKRLIG